MPRTEIRNQNLNTRHPNLSAAAAKPVAALRVSFCARFVPLPARSWIPDWLTLWVSGPGTKDVKHPRFAHRWPHADSKKQDTHLSANRRGAMELLVMGSAAGSALIRVHSQSKVAGERSIAPHP